MNQPDPALSAALPPRCPECCSHGVPLTKWCGWCDDINEGGQDDCIVSREEPMWLCPHGIGKEPSTL